MLNTFEVNKVLIIAPLRVARDTWPAEIEKWDHLKNLDISIVVGDVKTRIAAVHHPAMIYVVNRETSSGWWSTTRRTECAGILAWS